jgi:phosphoribosylanthranilate isomerase
LLAFAFADRDKRRMTVQVKICGITNAEAADAAARAGADYAGLVFHPASPRHLPPDTASQLAARLRNRVRLAVLLSDPTDETAGAAIAAVQPDFIQLHGRETPARVAALRSRFGKPIIKAIAIADASDFADVSRYEAVADMLLFDAKAPPASTRHGGHGVAFDWQLLRGRTFRRPWFLAGGLKPDNVARAIHMSGAEAVDVSSGVETAPGIKSAELISAFIASARATQFAEERNA